MMNVRKAFKFDAHQKRASQEGSIGLAAAISGGLGIAFLIIGAVVGMTVAAKSAPTYINATAEAANAVAAADFGDETANSLTGPFAMVIAIGGLSALVLLIIGVVALKKGV
jgi:hypothetical protein